MGGEIKWKAVFPKEVKGNATINIASNIVRINKGRPGLFVLRKKCRVRMAKISKISVRILSINQRV